MLTILYILLGVVAYTLFASIHYVLVRGIADTMEDTEWFYENHRNILICSWLPVNIFTMCLLLFIALLTFIVDTDTFLAPVIKRIF